MWRRFLSGAGALEIRDTRLIWRPPLGVTGMSGLHRWCEGRQGVGLVCERSGRHGWYEGCLWVGLMHERSGLHGWCEGDHWVGLVLDRSGLHRWCEGGFWVGLVHERSGLHGWCESDHWVYQDYQNYIGDVKRKLGGTCSREIKATWVRI